MTQISIYDDDLIRKLRLKGQTWERIGEVFDTAADNVRKYASSKDWFDEIRVEEKVTNRNSFKSEVDINYQTGEHRVYQLVEIFDETDKSPDKIMEMLGYKQGVWELTNFNLTKYGKEDSPMYAAKVMLKPDKIGIDWEELGNQLANRVEPKLPSELIHINNNEYLVIALFDLHFGNNTIDDYDKSLGKIFRQLENEYQKVLILSGGDLLHVDNYQSTTASGTQLDTTDMNQAWDDAFDFFDLIIDKSLDHAESVEVMYVPGNHDESAAQTLFKALNKLYRKEDRLVIDDRQEMYKATLLGHNFIGVTHGVKRNKKDYPMLFATQFSSLWGTEDVSTREVYTGHLHHEHTVDMNGLMIRQMPTRNKDDKWHKDNGFVGSHKRFQIVEYSEYETEMIRYV